MSVVRVIFDLDGTLVDSVPGIVAALTAAFAAEAPGHPLPALEPFVGPPVARMIPAIAPRLPGEVHARVLAHFRAHYDADGWRHVALLPGARDTLEALRARGVPADVATFKPLAPTTRILDALGLRPLVDRVRCVDGPGAPLDAKAAMIAELVAAAGVDAAEVVYVGDTPGDTLAAVHAGVHFVGAGGPFGPLSAARVLG